MENRRRNSLLEGKVRFN